MRKTAKVDDNRFLRSDGANLPAILYLLREKCASSYHLIVRTVQQVAPFFDDFLLQPRGLESTDIRLEWRHKKSDQYFDASSLSDGTLRFIALATLFLQPEEFRPSIILVDEPELGLHPFAIEVLAALVRQASVSTQVIVSTQSSLLLDHFQPEDVLVADRVDGGTQLRRLEPEPLAKWLEDYSLGQLWEKNEIGGAQFPAENHGAPVGPCGRPDRGILRERSSSQSFSGERLPFRRGSHCGQRSSPSAARWRPSMAVRQERHHQSLARGSGLRRDNDDRLLRPTRSVARQNAINEPERHRREGAQRPGCGKG